MACRLLSTFLYLLYFQFVTPWQYLLLHCLLYHLQAVGRTELGCFGGSEVPQMLHPVLWQAACL